MAGDDKLFIVTVLMVFDSQGAVFVVVEYCTGSETVLDVCETDRKEILEACMRARCHVKASWFNVNHTTAT